MTLEPGTRNWTQPTGDLGDGLWDRMRREALFVIDVPHEALEAIDETPDADLRASVTGPTAEAVDEMEQSLGRSLRVGEIDIGRGAQGLGAALEVAGVIADIGGTGGAVIAVAQAVRWCYRKLAERTGRRPLISLGAAEHLALADLVDRVNSEPTVFGSGDMFSESPDRAFTGGDAFYVVLATDTELHHYHVTAFGELNYIGTSPLVPDYMDIYMDPEWSEDEDSHENG